MSMTKPSQVYPNAPTSTPSQMPVWTPDHSINATNFDQLINQRGIRFLHKRAVPCPNVKSTDTNAHEPECTFCNDSGLLLYDEREVWGIWQGNSLQKTFEMHGIWEIGQAVVTMPVVYADGTQADFNTFDRLIVPDFTIRIWEQKGYEPRQDGKQFLRYPVQDVDFACSIVNNVKRLFLKDVDFTVESDGSIKWIPGREPGYNNITEEGDVVSFAYYAFPEYVVMQNLRELRVTQEMQPDGTKIARRLPQEVLVKRDFLINPAEKFANIQSDTP